MVFTSLTFIVFYVIVFALYGPLGKVGQNRLIVLSGLVFYGVQTVFPGAEAVLDRALASPRTNYWEADLGS